jgi:4-hydroxybenzoate polyprenyltransferase
VHPSKALEKEARRAGPVRLVSHHQPHPLNALLAALRPHQWTKNALLIVPLLTSHRIVEVELLFRMVVAFFSFSLAASSGYLINDLLDINSDREHPTKKTRPFASGALSISTGVLLVPVLLAVSLLMATFLVSPLFAAILALYFATSASYSLYLKRVLAVDVLILAGLYAIRVISGGVAVDIPVSQWLLAFSIFLFVSLASVKRFSELNLMELEQRTFAKGRGYLVTDRDLLQSIGVASGYLSVLVLALYINSDEVRSLYQRPQILWLVCPLLLYWITRVWFLAHRRTMAEDPVVFALKDPTSYAVVGIVCLIALLAL